VFNLDNIIRANSIVHDTIDTISEQVNNRPINSESGMRMIPATIDPNSMLSGIGTDNIQTQTNSEIEAKREEIKVTEELIAAEKEEASVPNTTQAKVEQHNAAADAIRAEADALKEQLNIVEDLSSLSDKDLIKTIS